MARRERDNVIQLRQRGGNWEQTRGRLFKAIMNGTEFQASNMHGTDGSHFHHHGEVGELPKEWQTVLVQDQPDYVVWSYETPIAWHVPNDADQGDSERWVVPDVRYSTTTTRHQRLVLTALIFNKTRPIERLEEA